MYMIYGGFVYMCVYVLVYMCVPSKVKRCVFDDSGDYFVFY